MGVYPDMRGLGDRFQGPASFLEYKERADVIRVIPAHLLREIVDLRKEVVHYCIFAEAFMLGADPTGPINFSRNDENSSRRQLIIPMTEGSQLVFDILDDLHGRDKVARSKLELGGIAFDGKVGKLAQLLEMFTHTGLLQLRDLPLDVRPAGWNQVNALRLHATVRIVKLKLPLSDPMATADIHPLQVLAWVLAFQLLDDPHDPIGLIRNQFDGARGAVPQTGQGAGNRFYIEGLAEASGVNAILGFLDNAVPAEIAGVFFEGPDAALTVRACLGSQLLGFQHTSRNWLAVTHLWLCRVKRSLGYSSMAGGSFKARLSKALWMVIMYGSVPNGPGVSPSSMMMPVLRVAALPPAPLRLISLSGLGSSS